jgi:type IV secretory pathway VirB10-like protein
MSETNIEKQQPAQMQPPPTVVDNRSNPPGVMRKSLQSWVIMIVALLMLLVIWLTSAKTKAAPSNAQGQPGASPIRTAEGAPSDDLIRRLREQERQQQENVSGRTALASDMAAPSGSRIGDGTESAPAGPIAPPIDPIAEDIKKRNYTSLFSSSVALSYRQPENKGSDNLAQQPTPEQIAAAIANLPIAPIGPSGPGATGTGVTVPGLPAVSQLPGSSSPSGPQPTPKSSPVNPNLATGKGYTIFEGTLLESVLVNRLNGDFSGPVISMLSDDVYSQDRQHLLIPAGSKLLGETKQVDSFGQRRLAVSFHRLIMPDGYSVDLDRLQGLNQIGETGLTDKVDHHYLQIFGASIAVGVLGGLAQAGTQTTGLGASVSASDAYRQGVSSSLSQSSLHILDRFLNVLPTITIREGHRVKIYLMQDLMVPDYAQHAMPSNL